MIGVGLGGIDYPEIDIFSVATGRAIDELVACVRPELARVAGLAIGEQGDVTLVNVVTIELEELASTDIFREDEKVAAGGLVEGAGDGFGKEGELGAGSARHLHAVELVGVSKAGSDQHLSSDWVPVVEMGPTKVVVALYGCGEGRGNRRDAFDNQVFVGSDCIAFCSRKSGQRDKQ